MTKPNKEISSRELENFAKELNQLQIKMIEIRKRIAELKNIIKNNV